MRIFPHVLQLGLALRLIKQKYFQWKEQLVDTGVEPIEAIKRDYRVHALEWEQSYMLLQQNVLQILHRIPCL